MDKSTTLPLETTAAQLQQPAQSSDMAMNLDTTTDDGDVSREALLMRAAELGPGPRLSLDNIGMAPTDPILAQKSLPSVAKRRARLRTFVKVAVGLCAGFAIFATAATALSSSKAPSAASSNATTASTHSDAPSEAVNPVEPLEVAATSKATPSQPPAAPVAKRRSAKRH